VNEIENGHLIEVLALAQTSMDTAQHLFRLLENEKLPQDRNATASLLAEMGKTLEGYELDIRRLSERTVEMSALKRLTCPVCSPSQRGVWDSTLWRLEQWLQYADATLTNIMRRHPPNDLEHLEDCVLSHRELLLDMDSHRSLVHSLTEVLDHLNGHEENTKISSVELHERLDRTLRWWKDICHRAAAWQARLQMALIENSDFHSTIRQFEVFISSVQEAITELEPVDLSELHQTRVKLRSFQELSDRLLKAEPELKTLQQSAEQLFVNAASIEKDGLFRASRGSIESIFTTPECSLVLQRVGTLDRELNSLLRVSEAYVKHLSAFIAQNPDGNFDESLEPSKRVLLLPDTVVCNPQQSTSHKDEDLNKSHKSYLVRGSRFVYRVVRASLPIQALMILLLGASSLLPYGEEDYSCATANSFARSFEPMLRYPNGPPPI
jgi:nesprin-1